jgi:hypothetical protein
VLLPVLAGALSCATPYVWERTDPREYVALPATDEHRARLAARHLNFVEDPDREALYAEKSDLRKLQDYTVRALAIPFAVTLDAVGVVLVVGTLVYIASFEDPASLTEARREQERREYDHWRANYEQTSRLSIEMPPLRSPGP